jgi:hypothetical protein
MDRDVWKARVLAGIGVFANRDCQSQARTPMAAAVSSFDEAVNLLFDDYDAAGFFEAHAPDLPHTRQLQALFGELDTLIEQLDSSDASFKRSAAWERIVDTSGRLYDLLSADWQER